MDIRDSESLDSFLQRFCISLSQDIIRICPGEIEIYNSSVSLLTRLKIKICELTGEKHRYILRESLAIPIFGKGRYCVDVGAFVNLYHLRKEEGKKVIF